MFQDDPVVVDTLTITVDVQERRSGVPDMLAQRGISLELVTLAIGHYAFGDRVVERKTIIDLARFGSIAAIAAASEAQLQELPGIGPARARALLRVLTGAK